MIKTTLMTALALMSLGAHAYEAKITKGQLPATFDAMLEKANAETQVGFKESDFALIEDRELATSRFQMYVQTSKFIPIAQTAIRIWSNKASNELILAELHLSESAKKNEAAIHAKYQKARFSQGALKSTKLSQAISATVSKEIAKHATDDKILGMKFKDMWIGNDLVREIEVRGRRGVHYISISLLKNVVIEKSYSEFPQSENFTTLKANVYPIYEEVEATGEILPYQVAELKYIDQQIIDGGENPLAAFDNVVFSENRYHPILAETAIGRMYGFWSEGILRQKVEAELAKFPLKSNSIDSGLLLQGKYVTINLHPGVAELENINFPLKNSVNHLVSWASNGGTYEAKPISGLYGQLVNSESDLLNRIPERLPQHDTVSYINSGVDEAQVYYGVTTLMEALGEMGFADKELSTKPFHAFLYDPDITMKDNAYYTDNTINFTTYSPSQPNFARDNPTIWHELGHGVMDRLMGPHLGFAGTRGGYGGLSEGMADFVAKLVIEHQTQGAAFPGMNDFRIINETGFYLTNEFHDEGEAYGGAMNDMLQQVIAKSGRQGLFAFSDLTLEAMRLTRNHPALSPRSWFEHMLYADELGSDVRASGLFKEMILTSLAKRNFAFDAAFKPAALNISFDGTVLTDASVASRNSPIELCGKDADYNLNVTLNGGDAEFIKFPATVKVEFKKGALQGAIKWEGEEQNPLVYTVKSAGELLALNIKASKTCESVNQPDGSCKDYAYIQVYNDGASKPVAKKRFYLKISETCK